jgi:retron-type reverse transcriptase
LYKIIFDPEVLIFACSDVVKFKSANKKNGISTNLNGISFLKVKDILKHVLKRSWVVSPVKKVFILKKKFVEARTLKILSLYDKIIATAIQTVLSLIFEKHDSLNFLKVNRYFFKDNHGFRPGKSCHTALNKIIT